jgi:hypothetical protein
VAREDLLPYADAPRLIAKARGGESYGQPHPKGLSALDRYQQLWRALEYCAKERGSLVFDLLQEMMGKVAQSSATVAAQVRGLGLVLAAQVRERPRSLREYCDEKLTSTSLDEAEHMLRRAVTAVAAQRPGDRLNADTRTASVRILVALRNAIAHTGAMSTSLSGRPYPEGCELLDPLVCASYAALAGMSSTEVEEAISHFDGQGPQSVF